MRLIDADALLEDLLRWMDMLKRTPGYGQSEFSKGLFAQLIRDRAMIDEAETVYEWIDATEGVPATSVKEHEGGSWLESHDVLVLTRDGKVKIGWYYEEDQYGSPIWHSTEDGDRIDVTHWMELPAPLEVSA